MNPIIELAYAHPFITCFFLFFVSEIISTTGRAIARIFHGIEPEAKEEDDSK